MALVLLDRAKETTTVVGTGTATLLGAVTSYQSLAGVGNGNTTYYCIVDQVGANWEVGIGTYTASGTTLARTTVLASSNGGALVVFTAGVKDVFVTYPSEKGVWYDASGNVLFTGTTTATNLAYTGTLTGGTGILNIGSGQLYKAASGNVGIGTSSPSVNLNVYKSSDGIVARFQRSSGGGLVDIEISNGIGGIGTTDNIPFRLNTNNTERMRIDSSGNVGIGTTGPKGKLHVIGMPLSLPATTGTTPTGLNLRLQNNDTSGVLDIGSNGAGGAWLQVTNATNLTYGYALLLNPNGGNVGIGTSSPGAILHTFKTAAAAATVGAFIQNSDTTVGTEVRLGFAANTNTLSQDRYGWIGYVNTGGTNGGALTFATTAGGTPATERMRIDSSGNLLVGTTSNTVNNSNSFVYRQDLGAEILNHISGTVTGSQYIYFGYNGSVIGSVTQNLTTGVLYNVSSDQRLKTNVQPAGSAIQSILDFPVDQFDWISDSSHQDFGGIAQKILKVIPEMVSVPENHEEMMGVDWSKAVPRLIKTIQELKAIIDTQQEQINSLLGK